MDHLLHNMAGMVDFQRPVSVIRLGLRTIFFNIYRIYYQKIATCDSCISLLKTNGILNMVSNKVYTQAISGEDHNFLGWCFWGGPRFFGPKFEGGPTILGPRFRHFTGPPSPIINDHSLTPSGRLVKC